MPAMWKRKDKDTVTPAGEDFTVASDALPPIIESEPAIETSAQPVPEVVIVPAPVEVAPARDYIGDVLKLLMPLEAKAGHGGDIKLPELRALRKAIEALRA